jgi:hypothetical protein
MRSEHVLDAGLAALTLVTPLAGFTVVADERSSAPPLIMQVLIMMALVVHSLPLLWRRQHPWWVLAAVTSSTWLGPLLAATHVMPDGDSWLFLFAVGADLAAVYAVAARGARPALTWLAAVASTVSAAFAISVLAALDPPAGSGPGPQSSLLTAFLIALLTVVGSVLLAVPLGACWLAGRSARERRQRRVDREEGAVADAGAQAELRSRHERARVAAGLRDAVLGHAARVPRAAGEADLPAVLRSARATLAAMRALLDGLDTGPDSADAADQPGRNDPAGPAVREVPSSPYG